MKQYLPYPTQLGMAVSRTEPPLDAETPPIELLVVDDNPAETLLMLYALEEYKRPLKFHFAKDGAEALQMLSERTFDLVILDLNLPKLSGHGVLKQCDPTRFPVVVFSVSPDEADARQVLELGAREFVRKPIELQAYKKAVVQMITKWVPNRSPNAAGA